MSWDAKFQRRKQWWSFQSVQNPPVPPGAPTWSSHPVDRFLSAARDATSLEVADDASSAVVLRRLHAILTGLPATIQAWQAFEAVFAEDPDRAIAEKVDELLDSPQCGERWARHWMDWFRYSEGQGGQGDPAIENAFENSLTVYDLWATIQHQVGIDHEKLTFHFGGRDFRLSDVERRVIDDLIA